MDSIWSKAYVVDCLKQVAPLTAMPLEQHGVIQPRNPRERQDRNLPTLALPYLHPLGFVIFLHEHSGFQTLHP